MITAASHASASDPHPAAKTKAGGKGSGASFADTLQITNAANNSSSSAVAVDKNSAPKSRVMLQGMHGLPDRPVTDTGVSLKGAKGINFAEWPDDKYNSFMEDTKRFHDGFLEDLERRYTTRSFADRSNDPRLKDWGTLEVRGQIVKFDNQGVTKTYDGPLGEIITRLLDVIDKNSQGLSGPSAAQHRAEKLAEALGGRITKAKTALSQAQFEALPPVPNDAVTIDYEAIKRDPSYVMLQNSIALHKKIDQERKTALGKI